MTDPGSGAVPGRGAAPGRKRISVTGQPLAIAPAEDEVASFRPASKGESVRRLAANADDRADGRQRFEVLVAGWRFEVVSEPLHKAQLRERAARAAAEHAPTVDTTLRAQIPGRVVRVWVAEGDAVEAGQRLLAVEAMKMENELRAPRSGAIRDLRVEIGRLVERDDELLTIA